ncbi:MAG: MobV family relaxase [Opitutaceae bacterium]
MNPVGCQVVRIEKIKTLAGLRAREAHNARTKTVANANPALLAQNRNLRPDQPDSICAAFDKVLTAIGRPKLRKNGVIALEYFVGMTPEAVGHIDADRWIAESLRFMENRHGQANVISARAHFDEKTPHMHFIVVPVAAGKVNARRYLSGKASLYALHTSYNKQVGSQFGLLRDRDPTKGRRHLPPAKLREATAEVMREASKLLSAFENAAKAARVPLAVEEPGVRDLLTAEARRAYLDRVLSDARSKIESALQQALAKAKPQVEAWTATVANSRLQQEELRAMKATRTEAARDVPLSLVAEQYFQTPGQKEGSSDVWEAPDHKLVITGAKFYDHKPSQQTGGGGAIDLVMHLWGVRFGTALEIIEGLAPGLSRGAAQVFALTHSKSVTPRREDFATLRERWAKAAPDKLQNAVRYLTEVRGIPAAVVEAVIDRGDLWANRHGSCVFAHRDRDRVIRGCTVRESNFAPKQKPFKQTIGDKVSAWFSAGGDWRSRELVLVESPIDALSFAGLRHSPDAQVISTAGSADVSQLIEAAQSEGRRICLGFDADEAGARFAQRVAALCASVPKTFTPLGKDWNEELLLRREFDLIEQRRRVQIRQIRKRLQAEQHLQISNPITEHENTIDPNHRPEEQTNRY